MWNLDDDDLSLFKDHFQFAAQDYLGDSGIVHDDPGQAFTFFHERLKRQNVDPAGGQAFEASAQRPRFVFDGDGEFLGPRHVNLRFIIARRTRGGVLFG